MTNLLKINKSIIVLTLVTTAVSLSNFWIYWIFQYNFFVGLFLIIESLLLFLSFIFRKDKVISFSIFLILSFCSFTLLFNHLDKTFFSISTMDSIRIRERQQYYANELGKVYKNRFGIIYFDTLRPVFSKISSNFFSPLDLSLYFSPKLHKDQEKIPLLLAPLFFIGFLFFVADFQIISTIYIILALTANSFIQLDSKFGPLLIFPVITFFIGLGLIKLLKKINIRVVRDT